MRSRWIVCLLAFAVCAFCVAAYFYIRHPVPWSPKQHHRLEVWASIGSAFTVVATLFSSLGLVALIWTIWVQIDQLKTIDEGQRDAAKQAHFLSLSQRVGEVISDKEIEFMNADFLKRRSRFAATLTPTHCESERWLDCIAQMSRSNTDSATSL